jgi:hypothetical protein
MMNTYYTQEQIEKILQRHTQRVSNLFKSVMKNREKNRKAFEKEYKQVSDTLHTIRRTDGAL